MAGAGHYHDMRFIPILCLILALPSGACDDIDNSDTPRDDEGNIIDSTKPSNDQLQEYAMPDPQPDNMQPEVGNTVESGMIPDRSVYVMHAIPMLGEDETPGLKALLVRVGDLTIEEVDTPEFAAYRESKRQEYIASHEGIDPAAVICEYRYDVMPP